MTAYEVISLIVLSGALIVALIRLMIELIRLVTKK